MHKDNEDTKKLFLAILSLKTEQECSLFFDDLLTIAELNAITQRLKVADMLRHNMTCQAIAAETGASTATISRVNKCLNYGGGYKLILERLEDK